MNPNRKILHSVWNRSADIITRKKISFDGINIDAVIAQLFCPGPSYYYVVDFFDRQIKYMHPSIEKVLGAPAETTTFDDIISRIHPDDMSYVAHAEKTVLNYLYESIGRDRVTDYKMSYCFRFRVSDGSYNMFQHQAIILTTDDNGGFARALNIHTNIQHLTKVNNYTATLAKLNEDQEYIHLNLSAANELPAVKAFLFSRREAEIIRLIIAGLGNQQIADTLSISLHTVKNHRKNIRQKAGVKTTGELISRCITEGLI